MPLIIPPKSAESCRCERIISCETGVVCVRKHDICGLFSGHGAYMVFHVELFAAMFHVEHSLPLMLLNEPRPSPMERKSADPMGDLPK